MIYKFSLTYAISIPGNGASVSELTKQFVWYPIKSLHQIPLLESWWTQNKKNADILEILGTMFTSNISRDAHIDKRVNASRRAMYALASVGCSYPGLATEAKVHLWKTIGLPSLLYNLQIFKLKPGQQKCIESVQSSIIKRIVGFPKRSHHTALLQAVNIDDVMSSVIRNTLSLWWRLFQVDNPARKLQIKLMK